MALDLCFAILPALRARWGGRDDMGGEYVANVGQDIRLPAYFRAMLALAAEPHHPEAVFRYWLLFDQDASFVMSAGIAEMLRAADLPQDDRQSLEAVQELEKWAVSHGS